MGGAEALLERVAGARQSLRAAKPGSKASKGGGSGRTYTSKYRGVHQTFPTRRWEAQFRCTGCAGWAEQRMCFARVAGCSRGGAAP